MNAPLNPKVLSHLQHLTEKQKLQMQQNKDRADLILKNLKNYLDSTQVERIEGTKRGIK